VRDMRQLKGDNADLALRSSGGVPQVSSAHHPDSRFSEVVAVTVRRVPRPRVAPQKIVGPASRVHGCGCTDGKRPRCGHLVRPVAQLTDETPAARDRLRGRPVSVGRHRQNESRKTNDQWWQVQWWQ